MAVDLVEVHLAEVLQVQQASAVDLAVVAPSVLAVVPVAEEQLALVVGLAGALRVQLALVVGLAEVLPVRQVLVVDLAVGLQVQPVWVQVHLVAQEEVHHQAQLALGLDLVGVLVALEDLGHLDHQGPWV